MIRKFNVDDVSSTPKNEDILAQFDKVAIQSATAKLAAKWNLEIEQDLKFMYGVDIASEPDMSVLVDKAQVLGMDEIVDTDAIVNSMANEIQAEVDREMVDRMVYILKNTPNDPAVNITTSSTPTAEQYVENENERLEKLAMPLMRKVFPATIANDLVNIQPMSGPVGATFALRYKFEDGPIPKKEPEFVPPPTGRKLYLDE